VESYILRRTFSVEFRLENCTISPNPYGKYNKKMYFFKARRVGACS